MNKFIIYITAIYKSLTKKEKVYCNECWFYESARRCNHPKLIETQDTPTKLEVHFGDCDEINRGNNCNYFLSDFFVKSLIALTMIAIVILFMVSLILAVNSSIPTFN